MGKSVFSAFEHGTMTAAGKTADTGALPWNPHRDFTGVYLKDVVTGDATEGRFTCHLVRIDPGQKIGLHAHPASIELHEVVSGSGVCVTEKGDISYAPGSVAVLAANSPHEVRAGEQGLCLFAKFITVPG